MVVVREVVVFSTEHQIRFCHSYFPTVSIHRDVPIIVLVLKVYSDCRRSSGSACGIPLQTSEDNMYHVTIRGVFRPEFSDFASASIERIQLVRSIPNTIWPRVYGPHYRDQLTTVHSSENDLSD